MLFTVETVSCLGACGLAPVVVINDEVHGLMNPDKALQLVDEIAGEGRCAMIRENTPAGPRSTWTAVARRLRGGRRQGHAAGRDLCRHGLHGRRGPEGPRGVCREDRGRRACRWSRAASKPKGGDGHPARHHVSKSGCQGFCQMGPLVTIEPDGILYTKVKPDDVDEIVETTLQGTQVVERLLYVDPASGVHCRGQADIPFYVRQHRTVLQALRPHRSRRHPRVHPPRRLRRRPGRPSAR